MYLIRKLPHKAKTFYQDLLKNKMKPNILTCNSMIWMYAHEKRIRAGQRETRLGERDEEEEEGRGEDGEGEEQGGESSKTKPVSYY